VSPDLPSLDFEAAIPELEEPEILASPDPESSPEKQSGEHEVSVPRPQEKPKKIESPPQPSPVRSFQKSEDNIKKYWTRRNVDCLLTWKGKCLVCSCQNRLRNVRRKWFTDEFGKGEFACYDPEMKTTIEISQYQAGKIYDLRMKGLPRPQSSPQEGFLVTFLTELGKKENVKVKKSDSEERQSWTPRNAGIVGARRFLIEGREITWQDFQPGDVISVERITDASIWIKVGNDNDAKEFKYLSSDLSSAGKMIQNHWPNQQLFRKFDRAPPSTWAPDETLWIFPTNQWHLWVKHNGLMRQIAFITEEQFFRQAENWANGLVNIVDENGQEVVLQDTIDTECYYLAKSPYARNITFRWDGLIMEARFDGTNARFWRNVRKIVDARELCLLDNGRFVPPDRAISGKIYQLVRTEEGRIVNVVAIRRGEEEWKMDTKRSDVITEIRSLWGEGDWKIVDRAGIPYACNDLRDGSTYYAVKRGETFQKQSSVRGFSVFTVNQIAHGHRFMIRCGNDVRHVWLPFITPSRIRDVCEMAWGNDANFRWKSEDTVEIDGKMLHVTKIKGRPDD
jgi:hypothetical protein